MTSEDILKSKTSLTAMQYGKKTAMNVEKTYRAFCSQSGTSLSEYDIFKAGFIASQRCKDHYLRGVQKGE